MNLKAKKFIILISTVLALVINLIYAFGIYFNIINLESFNDNTVTMSNNSQIMFLSLCVLMNAISTFLISKDLLKHKNKLIVFNVVQLFFGNIFNIISAILNITLLSIKTKDVEEDNVKTKKDLPILDNISQYKWYVYLTIFIFLFIICYTPILNLLPIPNTGIALICSVSILYLLQILLLFVPMLKELKRDFIAFKNNFKLYLSNMLPRFGIILIFYMISNFSLTVLVSDIATNQAIISQWPIYISAFIAIIIAPFTEELMFRGFMKKFIKNDILFILLSSLIFGALHVTVANSIPQLLFVIPYSILGFAFSLNYVKTRNIVSNIVLHSIWNSIAIIALIISKLI